METWTEVIISVVSVVLTAVASWLITKLIKWIDSKIEDTDTKNLLTSILTTVTDVVKQTYQTYVESLKDGNLFDEECQKTALASAVETLKSMLSEKAQDYIEETFGDIETWLTTQIEATIYTLKNTNSTDAE